MSGSNLSLCVRPGLWHQEALSPYSGPDRAGLPLLHGEAISLLFAHAGPLPYFPSCSARTDSAEFPFGVSTWGPSLTAVSTAWTGSQVSSVPLFPTS